MLMFPYILNLLAAMLLGALIGAERQWRQRMAGLRTNALVATGQTPPFSLVFFLGAGVHARHRRRTAATLWCSAGIECGLGAEMSGCVIILWPIFYWEARSVIMRRKTLYPESNLRR